MKYIAVLLFTMMYLLSVGQVRTYVIEASDTLSTNNVLRINGDIFNSTTKVSVNDTTLVSLQYLASVLASTEGVDSLSFNPVTGYLSYYSGGAVVDSLLFDGRYLTTEIDGSITNELQSLSLITSGTDRTINIAGGTGVTFSVADNDNSSTNEIQDLSGSGANLSGYTISLSGDATTVTLPNESDPVYAIDSAFIVRFSDIDTLGFLRTETDPVYSSDSSNIVWFSDLDIIRSAVIEASDSLITRGVLQVGADKFKATTQVSSDDTTLVSLDYLTNLLENAEYADSLAFHSGTGYLVYYRQGVALDSTSMDGRYQTTLTNPVTGTGTTNYLPKWTGLSTLGNSSIISDETRISVNGSLQSGVVASFTNTQGLINFRSDASAIDFTRAGTNYIRASSVGGAFAFTTNGNGYSTPILYMGTDNRIAVNFVSSPTQTLDVNGNARFRSIGTTTTSTVLGVTSDGTLTTNVSITDRLLSATANTSFTFNITAYESASVSTNTNITVTFSNIVSGRRGSIEVIYTGASVITFTIPSGYALYIGSTLYNSGTGLSKTVLSKSTGNAVYNYYVSGTNIYIDGNQNYN